MTICNKKKMKKENTTTRWREKKVVARLRRARKLRDVDKTVTIIDVKK